jgi:hypothetical protein
MFTVSPAYGRDYRSAEAAIADWDAGKDFILRYPLSAGTYINKPQVESGARVTIRYKNLTRSTVIKGNALCMSK